MRRRRRHHPDQTSGLLAIPLFTGCTDAELHRLHTLVDEVDVAPGDVVTSELEVTGDSYVIAAGEASVVWRERSVARLTVGDWFGDLASFRPGTPRAATVTAITPLRVVVIEKRNLAAVVGIASIAQRLAVATVSRLHDANLHPPCR